MRGRHSVEVLMISLMREGNSHEISTNEQQEEDHTGCSFDGGFVGVMVYSAGQQFYTSVKRAAAYAARGHRDAE